MARQVSVRIVSINVGDRTSLEDNERIARVEWNGRTECRLIILQDPALPTRQLTARQDTASYAATVMGGNEPRNTGPVVPRHPVRARKGWREKR